jgi:hypothetical protein
VHDPSSSRLGAQLVSNLPGADPRWRLHASVFVLGTVVLALVWWLTRGGFDWALYLVLVWALLVAGHALLLRVSPSSPDE